MSIDTAEANGLYDSIRDSLLKDINERHFLPHGKLKELMTPDRVDLELLRSGCCSMEDHAFRQELTKFIVGQATKCFATLVVIEEVQEIKAFYQNALKDSHLPVTFKFELGRCVDAKSLDSERDPPRADCPISKTFQGSWTRKHLDDFEEKQWLFLAPVFTENHWKRRFHMQCPLPFISQNKPAISHETLFSRVHQRVIHGDHIIGVSTPHSWETFCH
jgi:hypothetical protein